MALGFSLGQDSRLAGLSEVQREFVLWNFDALGPRMPLARTFEVAMVLLVVFAEILAIFVGVIFGFWAWLTCCIAPPLSMVALFLGRHFTKSLRLGRWLQTERGRFVLAHARDYEALISDWEQQSRDS
jgi:hypothetical protein